MRALKNTCWKWFPNLSIDDKAAQDLLNEMAAQGWELDMIWTAPFVRFRRTERRDLRYLLDWSDPKSGEDPDDPHLCEDAGWVFWDRLGSWNIYVSRPGTDPAPIQTDPAAEYLRFREKALHRMSVNGIWCVVLAVFFVSLFVSMTSQRNNLFFNSPYESFSIPLLILLLPLWGICALGDLALLAHRLLCWGKAPEKGPPSRKAPKFRIVLSSLLHLFALLLVLSLLADILLNDMSSAGIWGVIAVNVFFIAREDPPGRHQKLRISLVLGLAGIILLCTILNAPLRSVFPGRLPPAPIVESYFIDDGRYSTVTRTDGLLGSSASWWERGSTAQGEPDPLFLYHVSAWTWVSPVLAEQALERTTTDMTPLEETDGVWFQVRNDVYQLLFFRNNTLLEISDYRGTGASLRELPIYSAALEWLEKT